MTNPTTIEEVLDGFLDPANHAIDGGSSYKRKALATIEQLVLEMVKAQEYPDDVVLWTPDGNERTRVIKTEDVVAALTQLLRGGDNNA